MHQPWRMLTFLLGYALAQPYAYGATLPGGAELQRLQDLLQYQPLPQQVVPQTIGPQTVATTSPTADAGATAGASLTPAQLNTTFTLQSVTIMGVEQLAPAQFQDIFAAVIGQPLTLRDLYTAVEQITTRYRNAGYILARAVLPPQDITAGHVRVQVLEGLVAQVQLSGDFAASKLVQTWAKRLEGKPLYNPDLERALLLMNDLPGVIARSRVEPGSQPGTAHLLIETTAQAYSGSVAFNTYGTEYLGPNQVETRGQFNNLYATDWHNQTQIRGVRTFKLDEGLIYLDLQHLIPLFDQGTTLDMRLHRSTSRPGKALEDLGIESKTSGFALTLRHPFVRSRLHNLHGYTLFDWRDTTTTTQDAELASDQVRTLRLGAEWSHTDALAGISAARLEYARGLGILGASNSGDGNTSRATGRGDDFNTFRLDLSRLQRLNNSLNLLLAASGQYSGDSLLAGEEFGVGGMHYGRGYDASEIIGDTGVAAKAELHMNFRPGADYFIDAWQLFFFYDFGAVWNNDTLPGESIEAETLASAGFGGRFTVTDTLSADVFLAKPTTRGVASKNGDDPASLYFQIQQRF